MKHEHKFMKLMTWCCVWAFWSFMVVHYAHVKTPGQYREVASWKEAAKPWYDASFKL